MYGNYYLIINRTSFHHLKISNREKTSPDSIYYFKSIYQLEVFKCKFFLDTCYKNKQNIYKSCEYSFRVMQY